MFLSTFLPLTLPLFLSVSTLFLPLPPSPSPLPSLSDHPICLSTSLSPLCHTPLSLTLPLFLSVSTSLSPLYPAPSAPLSLSISLYLPLSPSPLPLSLIPLFSPLSPSPSSHTSLLSPFLSPALCPSPLSLPQLPSPSLPCTFLSICFSISLTSLAPSTPLLPSLSPMLSHFLFIDFFRTIDKYVFRIQQTSSMSDMGFDRWQQLQFFDSLEQSFLEHKSDLIIFIENRFHNYFCCLIMKTANIFFPLFFLNMRSLIISSINKSFTKIECVAFMMFFVTKMRAFAANNNQGMLR